MEEIKHFPTLFCTDCKSKVRVWTIAVVKLNGDIFVHTEHGEKEGKKQVDMVQVKCGKNIGKKNETSTDQQAISEATKRWKDKQEKGLYSLAETPTLLFKFSPMLAHVYDEKRMQLPCYVQPKLDGVRCIMRMKDGHVVAESRTGNTFRSCVSIIHSLLPFFEQNPDVILDGELFTPDLPFEVLVGIIKKQKNHDQSNLIKYHIYDVFLSKQPTHNFQQRFVDSDILRSIDLSHIEIVKTSLCGTTDSVLSLHTANKLNYEGSMIRNNLPYEQRRSFHLLKLKDMQEDEFEVIGFTHGKGRESNQVIWECKTKDGNRFQCRPSGSKSEREEALKYAPSKVGCMYTIIYQELTSKGVPRFPVGKSFRDYE